MDGADLQCLSNDLRFGLCAFILFPFMFFGKRHPSPFLMLVSLEAMEQMLSVTAVLQRRRRIWMVLSSITFISTRLTTIL